jgi:hypothetical protein
MLVSVFEEEEKAHLTLGEKLRASLSAVSPQAQILQMPKK